MVGPADEFAARVFVRLGNLGEFFEPRMFQEIAQVAEGILVRHQVNAEFPAARVELADFLAGQRAPALPDGFVFAIGERVFGVELQFVDFEIGEMFGEFEQRFELRHATAGNVQHHAAARKIRPVADFQAGQPAAVLAQQLPQRGRRRAQAAGFAEGNFDAIFGNRQRVSLSGAWHLARCLNRLESSEFRRALATGARRGARSQNQISLCFGSVNVPRRTFSERGQGSRFKFLVLNFEF